MADYMDIVQELCSQNDLYSETFDDGDNPDQWVLRVEDWEDVRLLDQLLKQKFLELGIDTSSIRYPDEDGAYLDFATDGKWVFSDTSFVCSNCYKCYEVGRFYTNYFVGDGEIYCEDCVQNEPDITEEYIESLINQPKKANTLLSDADIEKFGFVKLEDSYAAGMYGRFDDPEEILNDILAEQPDANVIFSIIQTGNPWETEYDVFVR